MIATQNPSWRLRFGLAADDVAFGRLTVVGGLLVDADGESVRSMLAPAPLLKSR